MTDSTKSPVTGTTPNPITDTTPNPITDRTLKPIIYTTENPIKGTTQNPTPNPTSSPNFKYGCKYNYGKALDMSLLFYEAQRSGKLPANNRIKWRKDSALNDGSDVGKDLSGGYYNSGDYVKFAFPMASSITILAWGMIQFKDAYKRSGQYSHGLESLKWATDYFIKCHTAEYEFYGKVGKADIKHSYWGAPEGMKKSRPSLKIDKTKRGSDLVGETAAALAACAIVFQETDSPYARILLKHAKQLFKFANIYRGKYFNSFHKSSAFYSVWSGYTDELAWANLWLFKATKEKVYKQNYLNEFSAVHYSSEFSWDNKWLGVNVLAAQLNITSEDYLATLRLAITSNQRTPRGLSWVRNWGPNRYAANIAFLAVIAAEVKDKTFYQNFATEQINYMLGDSGKNFVVGYDKNSPKQPHHRSSACPISGPCDEFSPGPNQHILYGALVAGPDSRDNYVDERDTIYNKVALNYNAGFQSAVAGLLASTKKGKCFGI